MIKALLILVTILPNISQLKADTAGAGAPKCSDEAKLKAFIRKGAMTKDFCLKIQGDKINLFVTGDFYKLGSSSQNLVSKGEIPADISVKTSITQTKADDTPESSSISKAKNASGVFAQIASRLIDKVKDLKKTTKVNGIQLEAIGYADGVRNIDSDYDSNILEDYFKQEEKNIPLENGGYFSISKKEFETEATNKANDRTELNKTEVVPLGFINILDPVRNIYLAERRANHLLNLIFGGKFDPEILKSAKINGYHTQSLATGKNLCRGYCSYRRGAKLTMTIPDLKDLNTGTPIIHPMPAPLVSLQTAHYKRFNSLNLYTYLHDVNEYLNKTSHPFKARLDELIIKATPGFNIQLQRKVLLNKKADDEQEDENPQDDLDRYFEIDPKETKDYSKRYQVKKNLLGKHKWKDPSGDKKAIAKVIQGEEKDFFQKYLKEATKLDISPDNVLLHWARIFFWVSLGDIKKEGANFQFIPSARVLRFSSIQALTVSISPPGLGQFLVQEVINRCEELLPPKINAGCAGVREYIADLWDAKNKTLAEIEKASTKRFLTMGSIYGSFMGPGVKDEMMGLSTGKVIGDYYDPLTDGKTVAELRPTTEVRTTAQALSKEIQKLKREPDWERYFAIDKDAPILVKTSKTSQDLGSSIIKTSQLGQTTSVYNALNTRVSSLWALKHYPNLYTDRILIPIARREGVSDVYLNVDRITTFAKDKASNEIKGFFHSACRSGVIFELDKKATRFNYLARIAPRADYFKFTDSNGDYDNFYTKASDFLEKESKTNTMNPFVMVKTKHPSTYVIPNCQGCNCVKDFINRFPQDGAPTDKHNPRTFTDLINLSNEFENMLITKAYRLNFHGGFTYVTNPVKDKTEHAKLQIKGTFHPQVPYKSHNAKNILEALGSKGESLDTNYCLYSPVIPQAHEVGDGASEDDDLKIEDPIQLPEDNCSLLEFLESSKNEKGEKAFPDVLIKPEEIDPIAEYCSSISSNLGDVTKCDVQGQLCIGLPGEVKKEFPIQCNLTGKTVGTGKTQKDIDFCKQLMK